MIDFDMIQTSNCCDDLYSHKSFWYSYKYDWNLLDTYVNDRPFHIYNEIYKKKIVAAPVRLKIRIFYHNGTSLVLFSDSLSLRLVL